MGQQLGSDVPDRLNGQSRRIGFGVIPCFIFAGMLSTAYTLIALKKSELHQGGNHIITALVSAFCLGLFIVTSLWFYERLESWTTAALLVGVMVVANGSAWFDKYVPQSLYQDKKLPLLGFTEPIHIVLFFPTCLLAFIGFALVLLGWRNAGRTVPVAVTFATLAMLTFVKQVEHQVGWGFRFSDEALDFLWQMVLVFFLGLSLWVGQITIRPGATTVPPSRIPVGSSVRNGFITLGILVGCFIGVQIWTSVVVKRHAKMLPPAARLSRIVAPWPTGEISPLPSQPPGLHGPFVSCRLPFHSTVVSSSREL
jgi:hypothetical protein